MKYDMFGIPVEIGDTVAINPPKYKGLVSATIIGFTPQGYRVEYTKQGKPTITVVFQLVKNTRK